MELKGKKINFLGDSITEGCGTSGAEHIYMNVMKKDYGLAEARNYGIGGTRIARQQNPGNEWFDKNYFIARVDSMSDDADMVVVFGGCNDYGHGDAMIGRMGDRTENTFYGACHVLIQKLIIKYPDKPIIFMTPLHKENENNPRGDWGKPADIEYGTLKTYVDIIREVTEYYSIPTLDLYRVSSIQPNVPILKEKYMPDGLHPNDAGHKIIAERLAHFILAL